jgi:hypothetical protein
LVCNVCLSFGWFSTCVFSSFSFSTSFSITNSHV